ncbi:MAG: 6-phospho-beta-glucosidase [Proteobacteria bacterium]|nr:6-phospho-beta-glucosidase [Pseudomonadota bacterium]
MSRIAVIGGGGVRTPFLIYGINEASRALGVTEVVLYDVDEDRARLMSSLGNAVVRNYGGPLKVTVENRIERAVAGATFVVNSVRVGGMRLRASDERIVFQHGLAGQETTGPGGIAMALRTIPVTLETARVVERVAPEAWFINFTNPAGMITQAISSCTGVRSVGICDTPRELFHRIAQAVGGTQESVACDYLGLNHLGWVRSVRLHGTDVTAKLLASEEQLKTLYPDQLYDPAMIRALGLIPSEYLFFCYAQRRAAANQARTGTTRGQEVARLTAQLYDDLRRELAAGREPAALELFKHYHRRRSGSYMKLEASAGSLLGEGTEDPQDPFLSATGYHRIAVDVMTALLSSAGRTLVVNTCNRGAIAELAADDVVEVPCQVSRDGVTPLAAGGLPESVRGLVLSVKAYERMAVRAAREQSLSKARLALMLYPIVGEWELAGQVLQALIASDPQHLGYLHD